MPSSSRASGTWPRLHPLHANAASRWLQAPERVLLERVEENERRNLANAEIDEEFTGDRLSRDFQALESGATAIGADAQLLALKRKMGMLPPAETAEKRQLGAGESPPHDEETLEPEEEESPEEKH